MVQVLTLRTRHWLSLSVLVLAGLWFGSGYGPLSLRAGSDEGPGSDVWTSEQKSFVKDFDLNRMGKPESLLSVLTKAPHPMGSPRQKEIARFLLDSLQEAGVGSRMQGFQSRLPKRQNGHVVFDKENHPEMESVQGFNVTGWVEKPGASCTVMLASHYDTKDITGISYLGANDGASSTIGLLNLAGYLHEHRRQTSLWSCHLVFVWFDGEESVFPDWDDWNHKHGLKEPDHTKGSRYLASRMKGCGKKNKCLNEPFLPESVTSAPVVRFILMDLTGTETLRITRDLYSDPGLKKAMAGAARFLSFKNLFGREQWIQDDHQPFVRLGIPSLNIIDFEDLRHWHQDTDQATHVNFTSVKKAAQIALALSLLPAP